MDNFINTIWYEVEQIFKTQFLNYRISRNKLDTQDSTVVQDGKLVKPNILILHPRTSTIFYERTYNGENKYPFYLNIFCLSNDYMGHSKMAGEVIKFVNQNQFEFSKQGLKNAQIKTSESKDDGGSFMAEPTTIYATMLIMSGNVVF